MIATTSPASSELARPVAGEACEARGVGGVVGFGGALDTCIGIRTLVMRNGVAYAQAGGGIVADSDPSAEYDETISKAKVLIRAIEMAGRGL